MTEKEQFWLQSLEDAKIILEKFNCKYFLDTGTLLGAIRDKRFIPWDNDIDIGVIDFETDRNILKEISKEFWNKGYNVTTELHNISISHPKKVLDLGIKFYTKEGGKYCAYLGKINGNRFCSSLNLYLSEDFVYKNGYGKFSVIGCAARLIHSIRILSPRILKTFLHNKMKYEEVRVETNDELLSSFYDYTFYNKSFKVPCSSEDYLAHRYGIDWNIPNRNYNYTEDDNSIVK